MIQLFQPLLYLSSPSLLSHHHLFHYHYLFTATITSSSTTIIEKYFMQNKYTLNLEYAFVYKN